MYIYIYTHIYTYTLYVYIYTHIYVHTTHMYMHTYTHIHNTYVYIYGIYIKEYLLQSKNKRIKSWKPSNIHQ